MNRLCTFIKSLNTMHCQELTGQGGLSLTNEENCHLESLYMSRAVSRTWLNVEYLSRSAQNQNITISRRFVCLFRAKTKIKRKERKQENS